MSKMFIEDFMTSKPPVADFPGLRLVKFITSKKFSTEKRQGGDE